MKNLIVIIALALALCATVHAPAHAADPGGTDREVAIDLPTDVRITKETDVTAAMFSRLFGSSWHEVAGTAGQGTSGGLGVFSGLIVSVLGTLNVAAMAFVSASIIYMWGIFAVTTAHEGSKLGGSVFNSLWVPVRHAFSFSLTVPVMNGLSLLQVAIIAMVSMSINFANTIWDTSGAYIVKYAHTGIIDSSAPMLETEAYQMMPVMFEAAVFQEMVKIKEETSAPWADTPVAQAGATGRFENEEETYSRRFLGQNGEYVVETRPLEGVVKIYARPVSNIALEDMGSVNIPYPKWSSQAEPGGNYSENNAGIPRILVPPADDKGTMAKISKARIEAAIALWEQMREQAKAYLGSNESTKSDVPFKQGLTGSPANYMKAVAAYKSSIAGAVGQAVNEYVSNEPRFRELIGKAIDSDGKESKYGWASAGMFTFTLASLQKKVDDEIMRNTSYTFGNRRAKDTSTGFAGLSFTQMVYNKLGASKDTLLRAPHYFAVEVLQNTRVGAADAAGPDKSGFEEVGTTIAKNLLTTKGDANGRDRTGVLAAVLDEFGTYDPIVVMQSFGDRLLSAASALLGISILGALTGVGIVGAMTVIAVFAAGAMFAYVVPITPFIFWMQALVSWIFLVIETMVAAPFWACVHALPNGTGFAGERARQGYMMLIDILIRPVLLVLGATFAVAMMQAVGWLFGTLMNGWFVSVGEYVGRSFVADIVFSIVVMSVMYYASLTIFTKGVNYMPQHVSRWMGGTTAGSGLGAEGDHAAATKVVGGVINQGGSAAGTLGGGLTGAGSKMYGKARTSLAAAKQGGTGGEGPKADLPAAITPKDE